MTKERIKVISDKLQKAVLNLAPDEKLEKTKAKMLKEVENKITLEFLKNKEKPSKRKEIVSDLLMHL